MSIDRLRGEDVSVPQVSAIALAYVIVSGLWILLSDQLVVAPVEDMSVRNWVSTLKGWGFVAITALLLYWLMQRMAVDLKASRVRARADERRFRRLINGGPSIIYALEPFEGGLRPVLVSDSVERILGYTVEEPLDPEWWRAGFVSTEGKRTIRTILVIDEAHNYLDKKNIFLQRIIREGRSKGVVVFFASRYPNDYQQKLLYFVDLLEFAYIFQCDGVAAGSAQDMLGCRPKTAKDPQTEIARLEPWQAFARSQVKTEEFVKLTAGAFYKCYS